MKKFTSEFKSFVMRGNVVDLAVAVIIGGAFGKIVTSLVNDIIMPPIGVLLGGIDFTRFRVVLVEPLKDGGKDVPAVTLNYGVFIQEVVNFMIIALSIFVMIKILERFKQKNEPKKVQESPKETELSVLMELRDLIKDKK